MFEVHFGTHTVITVHTYYFSKPKENIPSTIDKNYWKISGKLTTNKKTFLFLLFFECREAAQSLQYPLGGQW